MRRKRAEFCPECGEKTSDGFVGGISRVCIDCAVNHVGDAARQISEGAGPHYDKYRASAASLPKFFGTVIGRI